MGKIMQRCRQCGELQDANNFRPYYNRKNSRCKTCKTCEKINNRYKYLDAKVSRDEADTEEYEAIQLLYEAQAAAGLKPPLVQKEQDDIMSLIKSKMTIVEPIAAIGEGAPYDLTRWLTEDISTMSPESLEDIHDKLTERYAPVIRINADTGLPIREDKFKATLDKVLDRFMEYEDTYYTEQEED